MADQWLDIGTSRDVVVLCSECRPQWRDWAVSVAHGRAMLMDHALAVHGAGSAAHLRAQNRERARKLRGQD